MVDTQESRHGSNGLIRAGVIILALGGLAGFAGSIGARFESHRANRLGQQSRTLQQQYPYIDNPGPGPLSDSQQQHIQHEHDLIRSMTDPNTKEGDLIEVEIGGAIVALGGICLIGVDIAERIFDNHES